MEISLSSQKIFIASKAVDFRSAIDGLSAIIVEDMKLKPAYFCLTRPPNFV
jgi:hypothetical protein